MIVKQINEAYALREEFRRFDRDYYSLYGYDFILEQSDYEEQAVELDVVGICCDLTEYGNDCTLSFETFYKDQGKYVYSKEEFLEDNELDESEYDFEEHLEKVFEKMQEKTLIYKLPNGNFMVFS